MPAELHRVHFGCASLPRPCCSSDIRPVICCVIPAVRASVCMLPSLRLSPRTAWRGGFSPGACRPPCALLLLSAHNGCTVPPVRRRDEAEDCRERLQVQSWRAGMLRYVRMDYLSLSLSFLTPLCLVAPPAVAARYQVMTAQLLSIYFFGKLQTFLK